MVPGADTQNHLGRNRLRIPSCMADTRHVSVGEYAGVPLQDTGDTWRNGAVFLLRKAPRRSESVSLDGWVTSVVEGTKAVVTCGQSTAASLDETFDEALTAVNRGLDYLSATGAADCAIRDAHDECIVWWPDPAQHGTVMRYKFITTHQVIINMTATVRDPEGNVVPSPPPPTPMVHDAFRFIRMSRTSDDLYDSYRNLFLAFECLLSDIRPPRQIVSRQRWWSLRRRGPRLIWESEKHWFMDALSQAEQLVPLDSLTPADVQNHKKWIYKHMYGQQRSALMHAKQNRGREYLLPQDQARGAELTASLVKLWDYIRSLNETHLGVRARRGGVFAPGWAMMADPVLSAVALFASDDASELNPQPGSPLPKGSAVVEIPTTAPAADPADNMLRIIFGGCDAANLQELETIRKIGAKSDEGALVVSELTGPLRLGDCVTRFEVLSGMRNANPSEAPRTFSS